MRKLILLLLLTPHLNINGQQHKVVLTPYFDCYLHYTNGKPYSKKGQNGTKKYLLISSPKTNHYSNEEENRTIFNFGKTEFDIDDLMSAELKLFYRGEYGPYRGENDFDVHWYGELKKNNKKSDVNWDNAPGIDYSLSFLRIPGPGECEENISIDVTPLLKLYYDPNKYIGLCLKISMVSYFKEQQIVIASKEDKDKNKHPQLVLTLKGETKANRDMNQTHLQKEKMK